MRSILVTGANGFVGTAVCDLLRRRQYRVVAAVRRDPAPDQVAVGELGPETDWRAALRGCDAVIHLAARVHVMEDGAADPLQAYRRVNVEATLRLARQAWEAGVRRLVFVSSVKVNGEASCGVPFAATDVPAPSDPYGKSKLEAERALLALSAETGLEVVIVRPPLVYGPGVKANFRNLLRLVQRGLPLPFGRAQGRRSMVALDNLSDLLVLCAEHPQAPGQVFMVSDGQDVTTGDLVRAIGSAMGRQPRLLPVPVAWMRLAARALGKAAMIDRLFGSLQVDTAPTVARLGWRPVVAPRAAIEQTVAHFLASQRAPKA